MLVQYKEKNKEKILFHNYSGDVGVIEVITMSVISDMTFAFNTFQILKML